MPRRQCILLPPSKGKSAGGDGPAYGDTLRTDHTLGVARRTVLQQVMQAASLSDDRLVSLAGIRKADVGQTRSLLAQLATSPTMPASRRYRGIVHGNASLADYEPQVVGRRVVIVSALMGLVRADEPVPDYRLEFSASVDGVGGLATYWRQEAAELMADYIRDARVWDLLPAEHARIWPKQRSRLMSTDTELVTFRFVRADGKAANAARTKVAKGRIAALLLAEPDLTPQQLLEGVNLDEPWELGLTNPGHSGSTGRSGSADRSKPEHRSAQRPTTDGGLHHEIVATWSD